MLKQLPKDAAADARDPHAGLGDGPDRSEAQRQRPALDPREGREGFLATTPTMLAYFHRHRTGQAFVRPDASLGLAENFLYMLNGVKPTSTMAQALDVCLVLHTDHGLNNSTFTARVIISTLSDIYLVDHGRPSALSAARSTAARTRA
jgi:citrate synthase